MAKITLLIFTFIFFFLSSTSFAPLSGAFAQEELTIKETTESLETTQAKKDGEYTLPYPGLLPDNPLYFLKALRDRVVDFLISDPLKKADFYLLQADKRLNAGVYLIRQGKSKYQLAESTISKGENYFERAISKVKEAKRQKMETGEITQRLYQAAKKHQGVLSSLGKDVKDSNARKSLSNIEKRVMGFEKEARSLIKK